METTAPVTSSGCNTACAASAPDLRPESVNRALRLEYVTVGWNVVEGIVAVTAALIAGSVAILGFGIDSFVECASALVMIWRLRAERDHRMSGERLEAIEHRARKMAHWVQLQEWLKHAGVHLAILQGAGGATGPLAELVHNVVASFAEFERDLIRERQRDARGRARARGLRTAGRAPLGYRADPNTRQLVVDPEEAALVTAFFERCAAGEPGAAIAAWANAAGHRTKVHGGQGGRLWTGRTVLQVLHNPIYVGRRAHGAGTVAGVHEAIIGENLAKRALVALDARRTRTPSPRPKAPAWDADPWMLRGLLRCAGCGRVMTTTASTAVTLDNADDVPRYYRCRGEPSRPACTPPVQAAARHVEARVLDVLREASPAWFPNSRSRGFLAHIAPNWSALPPGERNAFVRGLVWAAQWDDELGLSGVELDDITIDRFIDETPSLAASLPPREA